MSVAVVILAAGRGTRMKSDLPKALHPMCGKPMLNYLIESARTLKPKRVIVVAGYKIELVREAVGRGVEVVEQKKQLGSGHAVSQAERRLAGFSGSVVVLYCDTPLVSAGTLKTLLENRARTSADCTLLSVNLADPTGYGRVKRAGSGGVEKIIEENDASADEKSIREINVGSYVFDAKKLFGALKRVQKNPKKKEYYLTDVVEILAEEGRVEGVVTEDAEEVRGVNTLRDLAALESVLQKKILDRWMDEGVRILDPGTTRVDADVRIGRGTRIQPNTVIEEGVVIGEDCVIGPFARIRGGSVVGDRTLVGNFVEVVRSRIGRGTQIKHLSYIGDAEVGDAVNVGAGTITANYDGKEKHRTIIKDRAQIGSGTVLIAPVTVGKGAKTGAGAVVPKHRHVPDGAVVAGVPARALFMGKKRKK